MDRSARKQSRYASHSVEELRALLVAPHIGGVAKGRIREELARRTGPTPGDTERVVAPTRLAGGVLKLVVPWTGLAEDNQNRGIAGGENREKRRRFKASVACFQEAVKEQYSGPPSPGPVAVDVQIYVPDNRVRDAPNWWKAIGDGLKGLVITDDRWQVMRRATIEVAGIDPDRPRAEISVKEVA